MWLSLQKNKSIYFEIFKKFMLLEKVKKSLKVYFLTTNQRDVFFSKEFINLCEDYGINKKFFAP